MAKKIKKDVVMDKLQQAIWIGGITQVALIELLMDTKVINREELKTRVNKIITENNDKKIPIEKIDLSYIG